MTDPESHPHHSEDRPAVTGRILVVDDEPTLRMGFRLALVTDGFEVEVAEDGDAALEALNTGAFDLMVLDLRMPGLDGIGVLERQYAAGRHVPTVVASAHVDAKVLQKILRLGAIDILSKPVRPDDLRQIVRSVLREEAWFRSAGQEAGREVSRARGLLRRRAAQDALSCLQAGSECSSVQLWRRVASVCAGIEGPPVALRDLLAWNRAGRKS